MTNGATAKTQDFSRYGFEVVGRRHAPGRFDYGGDEHVFLAVDATPGARLMHATSEPLNLTTSPQAIHFIPPGTPSSWQHDRPISHVQVRIERYVWRQATGSMPESVPPLAGHIDPASATLTRLLHDAVRGPLPPDSPHVRNLLTALVTSVVAHGQLTPARDRARRTVDEALKHIEEDPVRRVTVATLAHAADMTPRQFARLFALQTGVSPYQFVIRARLDRAEQLLHDTDWPISVIAERAGFFDQAHLTRSMRRHRSTTPAAVRAGGTR